MAPLLSVVVPTYNEAANVGPLLVELRRVLAGVPAEVVVVDDDSKDGTAAAARRADPTCRVVVRKGERGLATAVVRGLREAQGEYVAVMDADFQHPPAAVRAMLDKALATQADLVVGSRYAKGGSEGGFSFGRRVISKGARLLSRLALPPVRQFKLTDPMSGLFLVRRDRVDPLALRPSGYKILLEILARSDLRRVEEVGYTFADRRGGASKLGGLVIFQYLLHVLALGLAHRENQRMLRFALVGASGVLVTEGLLIGLHEGFGLEKSIALLLAVEAAILTNFLLNDAFTFRDRHDAPFAARLGMFNLVSLGGLVANFLFFFVLHYLLDVHYVLAEAIAIVGAFGVNYLGNVRFTYGRKRPSPREWAPTLVLIVAATGLYFTALDSVPDFYFDESYYLAVAHQMDAGVWFDGCHSGEEELWPLNYEHPPLAKLILFSSVRAYDTHNAATDPDNRGVFAGCRDPDDNCPNDGDEEKVCWRDGSVVHRGVHCNVPGEAKQKGWKDCAPCPTPAQRQLVCWEGDDGRQSGQACYVETVTYVEGEETKEGKRISMGGKECFQAWGRDMRAKGNPYAWRGPSAAMGVITVAFAALAARRLFDSVAGGVMAGGFVLMDNLVLSSSRIAILDIFATGFMVMAIYFATRPTRWGVFLTTLALGLGFSCKFYVLFAGLPILLISLWSHWRAGVLRRRRFDLHVLLFPLMPVLVFLASYLPYFVPWVKAKGFGWAVGHFVFVQERAFIWDTIGKQEHQYSSQPLQWIPMTHPMNYINSYTSYPEGVTMYRDIYAIGNPMLWWGASLAAIVILALFAARYSHHLATGKDGMRHAPSAGLPAPQQALAPMVPPRPLAPAAPPPAVPRVPAPGAEAVDWPVTTPMAPRFPGPAPDPSTPPILAVPARMGPLRFFGSRPRHVQGMLLAALLPVLTFCGFLVIDHTGRTMFIFYMTLIAPLFAIALAGAASWLWESWRRWTRGFAIAIVALVAAGFVVYFPVSIYIEMPRWLFRIIMGLNPWMNECGDIGDCNN